MGITVIVLLAFSGLLFSSFLPSLSNVLGVLPKDVGNSELSVRSVQT